MMLAFPAAIWSQIAKISALAAWCGLFAASLVITTAVGLAGHAPARYYGLCVALGVAAFVMVPLAIQLCRYLLVRWSHTMNGFIQDFTEEERRRWVSTELGFFEFSRSHAIAGATLGALAALAYSTEAFSGGLTSLSAASISTLAFFAGFMAGWGLWTMLGGARAIFDLGDAYRERIFVTRGRFGITSTGRVLAQCWMVIGVVWFAFTLSALLGRNHAALLDFLGSYPVLLLAAPTVPLIIGCFVLSQLSLHDAMLMFKRREIAHFETLLRKATPNDAAGYTKEKQETIAFLERKLADAESLPDWPFSSKAFAGVGGAAFTAIFPVVLPVIVEGIFSGKPIPLFT